MSEQSKQTEVGDELVWGSLFPFVQAVLRRPRVLVAFAIGLPLLVVVLTLRAGPKFRATSSFTPESSENSSSRLAGLAQQLGIYVGGSSSIGDPVRFYEELLQSRDLLRDAVLTTYSIETTEEGDSLEGTYIDLYEIEAEHPSEIERRAVDRLRGEIEIASSRDAGIIRIATTSRWPDLAVQVNERLLDLISDFNLRRRQSQAGAERRFIETRLQGAEQELRDAEGALRVFLQNNRAYESSSELRFEADRLQRVVSMRLQVFTQTAQAFEQARIDEVRNTPVITVVEWPRGTARPSSTLMFDILMWGLIGGVLGIACAAALDSWDRHRRRDPDRHSEIRELRRSVLVRLVRAPDKHELVLEEDSGGDEAITSHRSTPV